ncbi:MAG: hypothetical protein ACRC1R_02645 [Cetobacterium sp.]|uniref:hypothetical protein n=1 Tax=Cetobacterium sp. TaxID=2071632 RepID=UPI003F334C05
MFKINFEELFEWENLYKILEKTNKKIMYYFTYNENDRDIIYNSLNEKKDIIVFVYENHKIILDCKNKNYLLERTLNYTFEKDVYFSYDLDEEMDIFNKFILEIIK